jgi:ligand-binding sensor domain-containing protein
VNIDKKWVAVTFVTVVVLVSGAYLLGTQQARVITEEGRQPPAETESSSSPPAAASRLSGPAQATRDPHAGQPETHQLTGRAGPLLADARMAQGHPSTPHTVAEPQPKVTRSDVQYTHFRVGNRNIKAIVPDGNLMWVGTSGGVIRYDTSTDDYRLFDVRSGLLSNGVFHLSKLDGKLAVGTYGGGLSMLDPATGTWENFNIQHGLADSFVYDVLKTASGDIWIATWSGANRVRGARLDDRSSWELYTVENTGGGLPNDWVYGLAEDRDGTVWMATEGGLARFSNGQWQNWNHEDGLGAAYDQVRDQIEFTRDPAKFSSHHARQKAEQGLGQVDIAYNPNYIVALLVGEDGVVWCGTWGGGLARFDGKDWRNYTVSDGLPANHVFMLTRGENGSIWVGTSKGLARLRDGAFEVFTTADGLFADYVFSMARDEQGTFWIGSFGGVARINGMVPKS